MSSSLTVLLIDRDLDELEIVSSNLRTKFPDLGVKIANTAQNAVKILQRCIPDLVITNLQMPGLNGFALLRQLREHKATKEMSVIVTCSITDIETVRLALSLGADDFIMKPLDFAKLSQRVALVIQRRKDGLTLREGFRSFQRKPLEAPVEILLRVIGIDRDQITLMAPVKLPPRRYDFNLGPLWSALRMIGQEEIASCRVIGSDEKGGLFLVQISPVDHVPELEKRAERIAQSVSVQKSLFQDPHRSLNVGLICDLGDISGGGMKIQCALEIEIGAELSISLRSILKSMKTRSINPAVSCIVKRADTEDGHTAYGLQFVKLDYELQRQIMKWCVSVGVEEVPVTD